MEKEEKYSSVATGQATHLKSELCSVARTIGNIRHAQRRLENMRSEVGLVSGGDVASSNFQKRAGLVNKKLLEIRDIFAAMNSAF